MTKTKKILATAVATLAAAAGSLVATSPQAQAATGQWSETDLYGTYSLKVQWCAGGTGTISATGFAEKNVCGFWLPRGRNVYAYVWQTGTLLYNVSDCGSGRWVGRPFPSTRDTSRTARVSVTSVHCP